ncbi:hypothetical protein, partial [Propioniciclava sinopodophylli]|uniref:hypothetical protein n=1 Tax=Propioniciclava sinopodophylli TaxID=1837344 RepID=UPI001F4F14D6
MPFGRFTEPGRLRRPTSNEGDEAVGGALLEATQPGFVVTIRGLLHRTPVADRVRLDQTLERLT